MKSIFASFVVFSLLSSPNSYAASNCTNGIENMKQLYELKAVILCMQRQINQLQHAVKQTKPPHPTPKITHTTSNPITYKSSPRLFTLQVVSSADRESAYTIQGVLKRSGFPSYVQQTGQNGKTWYKVRVGKFADMQQAEKQKRYLKTKFPQFHDSFVKSISK